MANGSPVPLVAGSPLGNTVFARQELRCVTCGYGVWVRHLPARCPMCRTGLWERAGVRNSSPAGPAHRRL